MDQSDLERQAQEAKAKAARALEALIDAMKRRAAASPAAHGPGDEVNRCIQQLAEADRELGRVLVAEYKGFCTVLFSPSVGIRPGMSSHGSSQYIGLETGRALSAMSLTNAPKETYGYSLFERLRPSPIMKRSTVSILQRKLDHHIH